MVSFRYINKRYTYLNNQSYVNTLTSDTLTSQEAAISHITKQKLKKVST